MIRFGWMLLTAFGFMLAGGLLVSGEFKIGGIAMVAAWLWMAFPKVTLWMMEGVANLFTKKPQSPISLSQAGVGNNSGGSSP